MITEQDLQEYNKWLMEVWSPNQYIPFVIDAPKAFLDYMSKGKNSSSNNVLSNIVCPQCKIEHTEVDCKGYCTADCLQESEGQNVLAIDV